MCFLQQSYWDQALSSSGGSGCWLPSSRCFFGYIFWKADWSKAAIVRVLWCAFCLSPI